MKRGKEKNKENSYKKIVVISIIIAVLLTASLAPQTFARQIQNKKIFEKITTTEKNKDKENEECTFVVEVNPIGMKNNRFQKSNFENLDNGYKIQLSSEDADYLISNIKRIDKEMENTDNPEEKMALFEEKLELLRETGILPSSFTKENLDKTADLFREIAEEKFGKDTSNTNQAPRKSLFNWGDPFIGVGVGFIVVTPFAQIAPVPIGVIGAYIDSFEIPIFKNATPGTKSLNFTVALGLTWAEILIGHAAITFGWAISAIPPKSQYIVGPFYSLWAANGGVSLTIYYTGPPYVTVLDMCIWGGATCVILPFASPS